MEKPYQYQYYSIYKLSVDLLAPVEDIWAEAQAHHVGISRRGDRYVFTISERESAQYLTWFLMRWSEFIVDSQEETWVV